MVLGFVGLAVSTYYENVSRGEKIESGAQVNVTGKRPVGRPVGGIRSQTPVEGCVTARLRSGCAGSSRGRFPYGYFKLAICLREDYGLRSTTRRFTGSVRNFAS